jgi:hypothetical protein
MSYGTIKVDTITFTDNSVDKSVSLSGLIQNPTFTGNITVTGTISGDVIRGGTTVSGATVTGTTANFVSGVFTTQISGATVTGTTASFTSGVFTNISGTTATITSGIIASGTDAAPSLAILADLDTGLFSPGANELAVATNGTGRLFVDANGRVALGGTTVTDSNLLNIQGSTATDNVGVVLNKTNGTAQVWGIQNSGSLSFFNYTASSAALTINTSNQVGIGNSSPAEAKLCVNGGISIEGVYSNYKANILTLDNNAGNSRLNSFGPNITTPGSFDFIGYSSNASVGTTRMFISSAGLVGIGTSSPGGKLDVRDAGTTIPALGAVGTGLNVRRTDGAIGLIIGYENAVGGSYIQAQHTNGSAAAYPLYLQPNGGNVGIGTTSASTILHVASTAPYIRIQDTDSSTGVTAQGGFEMYDNDGDRLFYLANESSSSSDVSLFNIAGGALKFGTSGSERGQFDSSGRLLVGTSTARSNVYIGGNSTTPLIQSETSGNTYNNGASLLTYSTVNYAPILTLGTSNSDTAGTNAAVGINYVLGFINFVGNDGTNFRSGAWISAAVDGSVSTGDLPTRLTFSTTADGASTPTERMTITNLGQILVGKTTTAIGTVGIILGTIGDLYSSISTGNTYHVYSTTASAYRFYVNENGGISNYSGNNINLSDEREKKNIEALDSTWDCLKAWGLKKFHYNEDADADGKRYGVIAQQVAPHCPEIISQWIKQPAQSAKLDEDGNVVTPAVEEVTRMGVKEQQMMWMAIKALQEAQTRIETLETEVAALKGV